MNNLILTRVSLVLALFLTSLPVLANSSASIESSVEQFLRQHYQTIEPSATPRVAVNPLNTSVNLAQCVQDLKFELVGRATSRATTRVSCSEPVSWRVFVTAKIELMANVVVAAKPIARDTRLTSEHLDIQRRDINRLYRGYLLDSSPLIGQFTKRNINRGDAIVPDMLENPSAVSRGDNLIIEARNGGISIKTAGTALEDGRIGEQIMVRNNSSGKEFKARVVRRGLVRP